MCGGFIMTKGICPICKKENKCASVLGLDVNNCWCMTTSIPKGLLETIPDEKRGLSCVCKSCVDAYTNSNEKK